MLWPLSLRTCGASGKMPSGAVPPTTRRNSGKALSITAATEGWSQPVTPARAGGQVGPTYSHSGSCGSAAISALLELDVVGVAVLQPGPQPDMRDRMAVLDQLLGAERVLGAEDVAQAVAVQHPFERVAVLELVVGDHRHRWQRWKAIGLDLAKVRRVVEHQMPDTALPALAAAHADGGVVGV